jgi:hypothetical protein
LSRIIKISDKLRDDKGVTLITLIIAITIFAVFITIFSYVMVAKHGSASLYVQSTQAYAVAQAGIEYGIRHAIDDELNFFANPASVFPVPGTSQSFGDGSFTLVYTDINDADRPNSLTSTGTVGVAEREIILQNFAGWVAGQAITLTPGNPPSRAGGTVEVPFINNYGEAIDIYKMEVAKSVSETASTLKRIELEDTEVWSGEELILLEPKEFSFSPVYTMGSGSATLSLVLKSVPGIYETWYCTFWHNQSDPQSLSVEFLVP